MTQGLEIHKSIARIKARLASGGGVQKGRSAMGYKFRGIEDFDNILCGMTAEEGINTYPRILSMEIRHGQTAKGGYQSHVILEIEWTYVSDRDGSTQVTSTVGEAMDTQDKACNKAMQASRKYADVMIYKIPVGGDDTEIYVPEMGTQQQPAEPGGVGPNGGLTLEQGTSMPADEPTQAKRPRASKSRGDLPPPVAGTHLPNLPADAQAETQVAASDVPVAGDALKNTLDRIRSSELFSTLYKIAQDSDAPETVGRAFIFEAITLRAAELFALAPDMKTVQEGFELVTALGTPDVLKKAVNTSYARARGGKAS